MNNASFGAYAEVVRSPAYRDDKRGTTLQVLPGLLSSHQGARLTAQAGPTLPAPVRCTIQPRALRVVVPRQRPGVPAPKPALEWPRLRQLASFRAQPPAVPAPAQPDKEPSPQAR